MNGIRIRPYRLDDAQAIWSAARESLAQLQPWMPWCHANYSIEESRSWLAVVRVCRACDVDGADPH